MSPATIRSWITKGTLRAMRAGRRKWLVRRLELDRMLAWRSIRRRPSSPRWRMSRSSCMRSSTRCSKGRSPVAATDRGDREWRRRGAWGGGNRAMRSSAECFVDCCLTSWTSADRGHEIGLAERCEAGIDEGLDVAGQGGQSPLGPWRFAMGWSEVAARNHARRLEREGWRERVPMLRGEGSVFFATRKGVRMLGVLLIGCTTPAPTW